MTHVQLMKDLAGDVVVLERRAGRKPHLFGFGSRSTVARRRCGRAWARAWPADGQSSTVGASAVAHGHPLGATGAGLTAKMLAGLEATGGRFGLQVMCIGHGMATATVLERL